jgi:hypothetical protein
MVFAGEGIESYLFSHFLTCILHPLGPRNDYFFRRLAEEQVMYVRHTKIVNADLASLCHTSDQPQPPEAKLGDFCVCVCVCVCWCITREKETDRERERKRMRGGLKKLVELRVGIVVF